MDKKWIKRYFEIARTVSTWSKDPSSKIGAVIIGDNGQIISQGYNGFPRGVNDAEERYNNRELKYKMVVHAELNAILNALYNGSSVKGASIFVHGFGIKAVYIDSLRDGIWLNMWEISQKMFNEANIEVYVFDGILSIENTAI